MRSARVDWGKSHRQFIKFSRGLRFRTKICIFSTRNHAKIILFDFFRTFRVMAPAATPQKYKNNTKYASDRGPFTARHNYAFPRTIPLCLWILFFMFLTYYLHFGVLDRVTFVHNCHKSHLWIFRFHMKIELGSSVVVSRSERTKNRAFLIACRWSDDHNAQKMIVFDSFQSARNPKYQ